MTRSTLASVPKPTWRAVKKRRQLVLSVADSEAFADAALNSKPVNARLQETVRRYRELAGI